MRNVTFVPRPHDFNKIALPSIGRSDTDVRHRLCGISDDALVFRKLQQKTLRPFARLTRSAPLYTVWHG